MKMEMNKLCAPPVFSLTSEIDVSPLLAKTKPRATKAFESAISAGKNTYVYDAHTYHTKVPPAGIATLINHYTNRGHVVLDPFCGSGMTGYAALSTGRKAIMSDLSPAAAFIAYNTATPMEPNKYAAAVDEVLSRIEHVRNRLYATVCRECGADTEMQYTVWSFGVICPHCNKEFVLYDAAKHVTDNVKTSKILSKFHCPLCSHLVQKRELIRTRRYPILIGYRHCGSGLQERMVPPTTEDLERISQTELESIPDELFAPSVPLLPGVNTNQAIRAGIDTTDKAYTRRALRAMAELWRESMSFEDTDTRLKLLYTHTSLYKRVTKFSEFRFWGGSGNTANWNVPAIMNEQNVFLTYKRKAATIEAFFRDSAHHYGLFEERPAAHDSLRVFVQSATNLASIPSKSVDYVFTDPPFGANINYSEMNVLWESWLGTQTETKDEAIVNKYQNKGIDDYRRLMTDSFREVRRVAKDGAWTTIMFHNSSAKVWNAISEAIRDAGLAIQSIQTFDKMHGTFKQFVSDNAVGYDLLLHCRKSGQKSKSEEGGSIWIEEFVRQKIEKEEDFYVEFLHVDREREFNYRKLYSAYLMNAVKNGTEKMDFSQFRNLVDRVRESKKK